MAAASIALPRIMRVGGGASQEIGAVLQGLGLQRPIIVTDKFLSVLPHFACCWICLVAHRVKPDPP